ncbi:MAG: CapA family protein [Chloroflexi bacterium]|nr:CapA family protein [Chloroflexota bacterium]
MRPRTLLLLAFALLVALITRPRRRPAEPRTSAQPPALAELLAKAEPLEPAEPPAPAESSEPAEPPAPVEPPATAEPAEPPAPVEPPEPAEPSALTEQLRAQEFAPKRRRTAPIAILAVAVLLLAGLGAWGLSLALGDDGDASEILAIVSPPPPTPTAIPTPTPLPKWRLLAGGDVLMDRSEAENRDPFAGIVPSFNSAELVAVNVEMVIATGGTPVEKLFVFIAPPSAAQTMAAAGVDVGNLGNNHSLDFGRAALLDTISNLQAAGVAPVGGGANQAEAYAPASFEIEGVRVAVLGLSHVVPFLSWEAGDGTGVASAFQEERALEAVRAAKAAHDVVIVMIHWGFEGWTCPNVFQLRFGDSLIEAGASVVLGTHPHVLQPIVERDGGIIAYSLGNFVWAPRSGPAGETGVLEVQFEGAQLSGYRFYPHVLDAQGAPVPADVDASARIEASVSRVC